MLRILSCLAALLIFLLPLNGTAVSPAFAQTESQAATQEPKPQSQWAVNCNADPSNNGEMVCRMVQNIVVKDTRQRLLTVLIQPQRGSGNLVMNLVLPHGLDFTKGVTAKVDEKDPIQLAIRTSDQQGAYAGLTISQELLADLRGGDEMKFTYQAMNGRAFNLGVSLAGFTAAQKKLVSN